MCCILLVFSRGRDSVVSTVNHYGLGHVGFQPQWQRDFLFTSSQALKPNQPTVNGYWLFTGSKTDVMWY
jgi:hypothetical protein